MHEIGHAIGLLHEQGRPDRDQYLAWQPQNVAKIARSQSAITTFNRKATTPYDFGSLMHYGDFSASANGQPAYVTMPPGIEIGQLRGFSLADVDAVRRLYGAAPTSVTVTSAPPGLTVTVDGQPVTTPMTYNWAIGSIHTIDVPAAPQTLSSIPYAFGRWNVDVAGDNAGRRTIRVDPGSGGVGSPSASPAVTVYTASFVRLYPFTLIVDGDTAAARAATTAAVTPQPQAIPGLAGLHFRANQILTLSATTSAGIAFGGWFGSNARLIDVGLSSPSLSVAPADSGTGMPSMSVIAYGSQAPIVRLRGRSDDGAVDGHMLTIDGVAVRSPYSSAYTTLGGTSPHQVMAVTPQFRAAATTRYTFRDWDGSTANPISVTKPSAGQPSRDVTANFSAQHLVTIAPDFTCTGGVAIPGAAADRFYDHGRVITANAIPKAGWTLAGWSGDFAGTAASQSFAVNGEVLGVPAFNLVPTPFSVSGTSRMYAVAGDPGFTLTIYGTGFFRNASGQTIVEVNGSSKAATFVDANRVTVALNASNLAAAGEMQIAVGNVDSSGCFVAGITDLAVQAAGYALPETVDVVEFHNAALDHYFITANPDEMAKLDNGTFKGWARTGLKFKGFPADSRALAEGITRVVCRYYGNPAAGLDSHFYSAFKEECDEIKRKFPTSWVFESSDVFQAVTPDRATGACPDGTLAVYRLFNNRTDANHRYTTDAGVRAQMIDKGYVPEGYGPEGVALCALA
jgi:phenylpyruvate tautomerase PptA (4-oxalocrotonate tautomerase family)